MHNTLEKIANKILKTSAKLGVGHTIENGNIRIHRYRDSIRCTDLTNAGKRGKKVDEITFDAQDGSYLVPFISEFEKMRSFKQAEKLAKEIEKDKESKIRTYKNQLRGVDVQLPEGKGQDKIKILTPKISLISEFDGFYVKDLTDINEETIIAPRSAPKKAIKQFRMWVMQNEDKIKRMTFNEIVRELMKNKIDFHSYYGLD